METITSAGHCRETPGKWAGSGVEPRKQTQDAGGGEGLVQPGARMGGSPESVAVAWKPLMGVGEGRRGGLEPEAVRGRGSSSPSAHVQPATRWAWAEGTSGRGRPVPLPSLGFEISRVWCCQVLRQGLRGQGGEGLGGGVLSALASPFRPPCPEGTSEPFSPPCQRDSGPRQQHLSRVWA